MGLAIGLDKPVYLYRPGSVDGVEFDVLCKAWPQAWVEAIQRILSEGLNVDKAATEEGKHQ